MLNQAADSQWRIHRQKPPGVRIPLRYQVLLPMSATMLITLVVISALSAVFAARRATSRVHADVERITGTLRATSFPLTDTVLETIAGLSGAELLLTDKGGARLASTEEVTRSGWTPPRHAAETQPDELDRVRLNGAKYFHRARELSRPADRGRLVQLHVLYPESTWREARREAIYPPLVIGGLGVLITAALSLLLSRRVTQPISRIADLMTELAGGQYRLTALPQRNDELRDLTLAANHLAAELDGLHSAIRRGERLTLLGRLASGLAHQMRNSATGARLAMQLHRRGCSAQDRESIDVALRQLELVEEQLVGFLTLGKPQEPRREACHLGTIVADVVQLVAANCKHRGIELSSDHADDKITVTGDSAQLRQMVMNLTLNALDAVDRGGRVRIAVEPGADRVRLAVRDSGPGVPDALGDSIFEPFVTSKPEGVGLGLAVASRIAAAHGAQLRYRRIDGETCFEVELPIGRDRSSPGGGAAGSTGRAQGDTDVIKECIHVSGAGR